MKNYYIVNKENIYFKSGLEITSNYDDTMFYVNNELIVDKKALDCLLYDNIVIKNNK